MEFDKNCIGHHLSKNSRDRHIEYANRRLKACEKQRTTFSTMTGTMTPKLGQIMVALAPICERNVKELVNEL